MKALDLQPVEGGQVIRVVVAGQVMGHVVRHHPRSDWQAVPENAGSTTWHRRRTDAIVELLQRSEVVP